MEGLSGYDLAYPAGIMEMFHEYGAELEGKRKVVIAKTVKSLCPAPFAKNATVTLTHFPNPLTPAVC